MLGIDFVFSGVYETLYALTQQNQTATGARERFDVDLPPDAVREVRGVPLIEERRSANRCPTCDCDLDFYGCFCADSEGGECD